MMIKMSMQSSALPTLIVCVKARGQRTIDARTRVARTRVARTRWRGSVATRADKTLDTLTTGAGKAVDALVALPVGRLRAALYGLLLFEAYVVVTLILTALGELASTGPFVSDSPPDQSGLVFLATILLPALLYGVRRVQKEATDRRAYDASVQEEGRRLRQSTLNGAYHILYLRPDAPLHVAEAAYIAAMKRAHPYASG